MRKYGMLLLLLMLFGHFTAACAAQRVHLQTKTELVPVSASLSDQEWRWLGNQRVLRVAVWSPEQPPFVTFPENGIFEGIDADYLHMLANNLSMRTEILRYDSRQQALDALRQGKVDAVQYSAGFANPSDTDFIESDNFSPNFPTLVATGAHNFSNTPHNQVKQLAVAENYMSDDWIKQQFPAATIARFPSDQSALSAVLTGQQQLYLGNLTTANFLIERNYNNTLVIVDILPKEEKGNRLLLAKNSNQLQYAIDAVLKVTTQTQHRTITNQWIAGTNYFSFSAPLDLTEQEKRWIEKHPQLKVLVNPFYAPFTFNDSQQKLYGISADVLRQIHLRTGLNFTPIYDDEIPDFTEKDEPDDGDMIASLSPSDQRESTMLFTRPYLQTAWVLVVKDSPDAEVTLQPGMRVAMALGSEMETLIRTRYPSITIVPAGNASLAMQMVIDGKADAAVNNLISGNYMIGHFFAGKLKIGERLSEKPAHVTFAVRRDEPELQSILNKALASIPPRTMSQIVNKWQQGSNVTLNTWTLYNRPFYGVVALSCFLIALALLWIYTMRREVSQRRKSQSKLLEELAFRETLLNGSPSPVYVVNADGQTLNHNSAFAAFFTEPQLALTTLSLYDQRHPLAVLAPHILPLMKEQVQAPQKNFTHRSILNDGQRDRVIDHWATAYNDANGQTAGLICGWQDVTDTEKLLHELSDAKDNAEKASKAKGSFLATMSHEIRTPISAIIGLLELSVTDGKQREKNDPLMLAWESAHSLLGLIGDILDMAKIESGQLQLEPEWVDLQQLVSPTVPIFNGLARLKNLTLEVTSSGETDYKVLIDPLRFKQILYNFISNALKFTEQGGVTVAISAEILDDENLQFDVTITDTGSGIDKRDQQKLFLPYSQLSAGKQQTGTGLGLFIAAELIQKMEGLVDLTSEPGKGTTVSISLMLPAKPLIREESPISATPIITHHAPLNILIVDDQPTNRMLLKSQLARLSHYVDEAEDGEQALELWGNNSYDLMITDCNMPGIDGLELTRLIREEDRQLLIYGLTANAQPEERERCLQVGMNDCLFKPLRLHQLEKILAEVQILKQPEVPDDALASFINMQGLVQLTSNNQLLIEALLTRTCEENRKDQVLLKEYVVEQNWRMAAKTLHRLAGSSQVVGLTHADSLCRTLESQCLDSPIAQDLQTPFRELHDYLDAFHQAVRQHFS